MNLSKECDWWGLCVCVKKSVTPVEDINGKFEGGKVNVVGMICHLRKTWISRWGQYKKWKISRGSSDWKSRGANF